MATKGTKPKAVKQPKAAKKADLQESKESFEQEQDQFEDSTKLPEEKINEEIPKEFQVNVSHLKEATDNLIALTMIVIRDKDKIGKSVDRFHNAISQLKRLKNNVFVD